MKNIIKNKKNLLILLPILVFIVSFAIVRSMDKKSYAIGTDEVVVGYIPDGDNVYYMGAAKSHNRYSHYYISNNNGWASGTKLLKTRNTYPTDLGDMYLYFVVYCAEQGVEISTADHQRYSIDNPNFTVISSSQKTKLNNMMPYVYPYISLSGLKDELKNGSYNINVPDPDANGVLYYDKYEMDNLNIQEAITAAQAAIWNIIKNTKIYEYGGYTSVSDFDSCDAYMNKDKDKIRLGAAEEENWSPELWHKYACDLDTPDKAKTRINVLIKWYLENVQVVGGSTTYNFSVSGTPTFSDVTSSTYTATVKFQTNMGKYKLIAKDQNGNQLPSTVTITPGNNNVWTLENVPRDVKTIQIDAVSDRYAKQVYWYEGSGQDFIGVDNSKIILNTQFDFVAPKDPEPEPEPGAIVIYKVTGASQTVEIKFDATDSQCGGTNQPTCLSGGTFKLYYNGKKEANKIDEFTFVNGKYEKANLKAGTYYIKEITPPDRYSDYDFGGLIDNQGFIKVEIAEGQTATVIIDNKIIPDEPEPEPEKKGKVVLYKVTGANKAVQVIQGEVTNQCGGAGEPECLSGARFGLYDSNKKVKRSFIVNNGKFELNNLTVGTYYIKEISPTNGYEFYTFGVDPVDSDGYIKVEITENQTVTIVINNEKETVPTPEPDKSSVVLYKVTGANKEVEVIDGTTSSKCGGVGQPTCLSGIKFYLYYGSKKNTPKTLVTDQNGRFSVSDLKAGTYYIKEISPAPGYDFYTFGTGVVDADGYIKVTISAGKTATIVVNNEKNDSICIKKVAMGDNQKVLDGAKMQILDESGTVIKEFVTSSQEGPKCFTGSDALDAGTYFINEVEAPDGYSLLSKRYQFTVGKYTTATPATVETHGFTAVGITPVNGVITIENRKGVVISKSDITNGDCVDGAELVVKDETGNVVKDKNGKEIGRWISTCKKPNKEGELTGEDSYFLELPAGKYTLTETMTEELRKKGFSTSETISFEVDQNGNVATELDMKDAPIKVCIYKVAKDSKTPLEGAAFNIYNEAGELYKSIPKTSSVKDDNCIPYMPIGKYKIKEIKAPDGYQILNQEVEIEVKDTSKTQEFYIENEVVAPKTALDSTKLFVIIASAFMMFGLGLVGYYGFKKQH